MRRMLCTLTSGALRKGAGQLRITSGPRCTPESSSVRCGTRSTGGSGGRRLPQAKAKGKRQKAKVRTKAVLITFGCGLTFACYLLPFLEDVSTEVLVFDGLGEHAVDVGGVYALGFGFEVRAFEADLVKELLHDGV